MKRTIVCPNCDQPSFTFWQKQVLAPGRKKRCRRCNAMISVNRARFLPQLLLGAAFPIVVIVGFLELGVIGGVALILLMIILGSAYQHYVVTLVIRSKP